MLESERTSRKTYLKKEKCNLTNRAVLGIIAFIAILVAACTQRAKGKSTEAQSVSTSVRPSMNTWPKAFAAPYIDVTAFPEIDYPAAAMETQINHYILAFVVARTRALCEASWGGIKGIDVGFQAELINILRVNQRGDVIVSFGGETNTELAAACNDPEKLAEQYQRVIDAYALTRIDFDIEGEGLKDKAVVGRRSQAIAKLQATAHSKEKKLDVWFTFPVLPLGLTPDGIAVIESALNHSVEISGVNIMAMNYGTSNATGPNGRMGENAIKAARSLFGQLKEIYSRHQIPKTDAQLWSMVGITPMFGKNRVQGEIFTLNDAQKVAEFAKQNEVGMLSGWSLNRDKQCVDDTDASVQSNCSSVRQARFDFTKTIGKIEKTQ